MVGCSITLLACAGGFTDPTGKSIIFLNTSADSVGVLVWEKSVADRADPQPGPIPLAQFHVAVAAPRGATSVALSTVDGYTSRSAVYVVVYRIRAGVATIAKGLTLSDKNLRDAQFRIELSLP